MCVCGVVVMMLKVCGRWSGDDTESVWEVEW